MLPLVAGKSFKIAIPMVVLPLPLSPTKPTVFPSGTLNDTLVTALFSPVLRRKNDDSLGNQTVRLRTSKIFTPNAKNRPSADWWERLASWNPVNPSHRRRDLPQPLSG